MQQPNNFISRRWLRFLSKHDIVLELFGELVARIDYVLAQPDLDDPIMSTEVFVDSLLALYREDESFYRAAFMGGERLGLFEHEMASGIFRITSCFFRVLR